MTETIEVVTDGDERVDQRALPVQLLKALTPVLARNLGDVCVFAPGETYMTRKAPPPVIAQKVAAAQPQVGVR